MQTDLNNAGAPVEIHIIGVNGIGFESANDLMTADRDLPWLQDVTDVNVWSTWAPVYRDVIILDGENKVFATYNLTANTLADADDYAALRQLFLDAADATAAP